MKKILFLMLFFISSLIADNLVFIGEGKDFLLSVAKEKALNSISFQIITEVNSDTHIENYKRGNLSYSLQQSNIDLKSNLLLLGIKYHITKKDTLYYVIATFDINSLKKSIEHLYNLTNIDYLKLSTEEDFLKQENYLQMLSSLNSFEVNKNIKSKNYKYVEKKISNLLKYKKNGILILNIVNVDNYDIIDIYIDNIQYKNINTRIFLSEGMHTLNIKSNLYYPYKKRFYLKSREIFHLTPILFKRNNFKFKLNVSGNYFNINKIKNLFNDNHLIIDNKHYNNKINITINLNRNKNKIYGMDIFDCSLYIDTQLSDGTVFRKYYFKKNVVSANLYIENSIKDFIFDFYGTL